MNSTNPNRPKFIVDHNVGKLAKWLRMLGFDTLTFNGENDSDMVAIALKQDRVILTRDTEIMKRRLVTSGRLKAILIASEEPEQQIRQVVDTLALKDKFQPFILCLECNQPLVEVSKQEVEGRVPPFVFKTQNDYMECPVCHRIYWKGTHWLAMTRKVEKLLKG
ncbi:MAG: Mut7-C RNAse domain-containing protein [Chloroflexi bacterium]|nr:Mut7-C RNAse domain-containing protein [Chloroflexota bacterium]